MTKQTAVDRAYAWLRERIIDGSLPGGSFIDEATVCEAAGVSRTPAREAFNRLEGERFITLVPRRGAQVRELNSSDLYDSYRARLMVETFAARAFCERDGAVPQEMVSNLALMDELGDFSTREGLLRYLEADRAFHTALVRTVDNRPILDFFESLWKSSSWAAINRSQWLRSTSWLETNRAEHHSIASALADHDADRAESALRAHLELALSDVARVPS